MFNTSKFRKLIEKARGDRSNSEYARESNVSRTYISQSINKSLEKPPSPEILKNLANVARNNITYKQLMDAAGYLEGITEDNRQNPNNKIEPAISDDPELLEFWDELSQREDLQLLFEQTRDLPKEAIQDVINIIRRIGKDGHKLNN